MKIIISHDVDHLTVKEHLTDLMIPKQLIRSKMELLLGKISVKELVLRYRNIVNNKWSNLHELMHFNQRQNIPATFFVGVNNGMGLNYSLSQAEQTIKLILNSGFDCGVHGIGFENYDIIKKEHDIFKEISGLYKFGIRMHYLRTNEFTLQNIAKAGYLFDSSSTDNINSYRIDNMIEFPVHLMESQDILYGASFQKNNTEQAFVLTKQKITEASKKNIKYFSLLFHDNYFTNAFKSWKDWYTKTIKYCKAEGFEFTNYRNAVNEH